MGTDYDSTQRNLPADDGRSALIDDDAASQALEIEFAELRVGHAVASMTVSETMVNGYGMAHGGYVFLLADTALAYAAQSPGGPAVSRQAEITFVSPAQLGETLRAEATERTSYGRNGIYDVTVTGGDGEVRAELRGHIQVLRRPDR